MYFILLYSRYSGFYSWDKMYSYGKKLLCTALVLLICTSAIAQNCFMRGGCRKTEESRHSKIDFFLCGDQIYQVFLDVCKLSRRRKREAKAAVNYLIDKRESSKFLSRRKRSYDIVEECCNEGCRVEEVHEYCGIVVQ